MNYLKTLGFAAVAAAALIAFLGAGTASATVLCTNTPSPGTHCARKEGVNQILDASGQGALVFLTTSGTTVSTCTEGTIKSKITNAGSTTETVKGNMDGLTWGGCTTTTDTLANGTLEVHHESGTDNGTVTSSGSEVTIRFLGVSCRYKTNNTDIGTLTGGNPATLDIEAIVPPGPGNPLGCPDHLVWKGDYTFTTPSGTLQVAAG